MILGIKIKDTFQPIELLKQYRKNKNGVTTELANKLLDSGNVQTIVDKVFQYFLNEIFDQVDPLYELIIPKRIKSGEILVKRSETDLRQQIHIRKKLFTSRKQV